MPDYAECSDSIAPGRPLTCQDDNVLDYYKEAKTLSNQGKETASNVLPKMDIACQTTDGIGKAVAGIANLGAIADSAGLLAKLSKDGSTLTRKDLDDAILLDSRLKDKDGPSASGPDRFLTDKEMALVKQMRDSWGAVVGDGKVVQDIQAFGKSALGGSVLGVIGSAVDLSARNLDPATKDKLGRLLDLFKTDPEKQREQDYSKNSKQLATSELNECGQKMFDKIDENHDGFLSKKELAHAVENNKLKGQEAQAAAAMYKNVDKIQNLENDGFFQNFRGISKKDLQKFDEMEADRQKRNDATYDAEDWTKKRMKTFDSDGSGKLSRDEIEKALKNNCATDQDKRILTHLKDKYNEVANSENDGWFFSNDISARDIEKYAKHWQSEGDEAKLVGNASWLMYRTSQSQVKEVSRALFADKCDPAASVRPEAIKQGTIGDCYFESALATMARQNPEQIVKMIKDNRDGTYTVTFPGDPKHPITVEAPADGELGLFNAGSKYGTWASVMEKAYGKYLQEHKGKKGYTAAEGADGGGWSEHPLELLTGKDYTMKNVNDLSDKELVQELTDAFKCGDEEPITADVMGDKAKGKGGKSVDGFPAQHSYSIVGFKPDGCGGGKVIIRNPWGGADGTTSGTMEITLEQFKKNFSKITYYRD